MPADFVVSAPCVPWRDGHSCAVCVVNPVVILCKGHLALGVGEWG